MAAKRHSNDDPIPQTAGGGSVSQSIVELLSTTEQGLVFWSRQPFEIAVELQLRVQSSALPAAAQESAEKLRSGWLMKRGLVVLCQPARRNDGSVGFQVSLLFTPVAKAKVRKKKPPIASLLHKNAAPPPPARGPSFGPN